MTVPPESSISASPDRCRVMVRDPYWLHAHWEVSAETLDRVRAELGDDWTEHRRILRVHSFPNRENALGSAQRAGFFDIEIGEDATSWQIHAGLPNRAYRVDVGVLTSSGLFYPLASSNSVTTPPEAGSEVPGVTRAPGIPEPTAEETRESRRTQALPPVSRKDPPRPPVEPPSRPTPRWESQPGATRASVQRDFGRQGDPVQEPPSWGTEMESGPGALAPEEHPWPFAEVSASARGLQPSPQIGWSPGAEAENRSDQPATPEERAFRFLLKADLVLYGTSEPGAQVLLQGEEVDVRPDGSFSIRFTLPEGEQHIPAVAVSKDGRSRRTITLVIRRVTESRANETGGA